MKETTINDISSLVMDAQICNEIVSANLARNPQLAHHLGKEVSLKEFALAVVIQYKAKTATIENGRGLA